MSNKVSMQDDTTKCAGSKIELSELEYLIIDVDGTMTDGGIYYDERGNEQKKFNTRDAAGFFAAKNCGIKIVVLTGRECTATAKRMKDLQVDLVVQKVTNKVEYLAKFIEERKLQKGMIGYIGDDLNDYEAMRLTGFVGCPKDSCEEILEIADYISTKKGGDGVIRDVIHFILSEREQWEDAINNVYRIGV